ncbi:cellulose synthase-like protein G3 [Lactuca sativa]|nr:cellulose synthase-like protein G3 [Lactuca sativa]
MMEGPLHTSKSSPSRWFNRLYTLVYTVAIFALLYHHCRNLIYSPSLTTLFLLLADLVLAFFWATWQSFFFNPVHRQVFPENLAQVAKESDYPGLDVFVCTADPFKEPPVGVINTVLSVLAYDYPTDKLSVYLSDDGGSQLTLFAFMEAAKFAKHWLPYCKKYNILDRSPEVHFRKDPSLFPETNEIQVMYETMKTTIKDVMDKGAVDVEQFDDDRTIKALNKWTSGFTRHQHPTVIEVLLKRNQDKDVSGHYMPNLFYLAREKNKATPHNFKAGAINAMLRVSATLTNAPIFLILDCDMYSNDPKTPLLMLCYFLDPTIGSNFGFVQFPQLFYNINKYDTYTTEHVLENRICTSGMDGLEGMSFMGTNAFFKREALTKKPTEAKWKWNDQNESEYDLPLAHRVANCSFEENTKWGSEIGFRYGTLVEDAYTSFRLQCLGWKSVTCRPDRPAFLGNMPVSLNDFLMQTKRWYMGLLQVAISKFSPITFGVKNMNPLQALCHAYFQFRAFWSIPIIIYAFLPQLALINSTAIFPKVSDPWFSLYTFLFLGAYGKNLLDYVVAGSTLKKWWSYQRMWLILGCSTYLFSFFDWLVTSLGMSTLEFNVTSKVSDDEQEKRYQKGIFSFGVESPMFVSINVAVIVNFFAFLIGIRHVFINNGRLEELFGQLLITGFGVVIGWPIFEGMVLRSDKGKMPTKTTLISVCVALFMHLMFSSAF